MIKKLVKQLDKRFAEFLSYQQSAGILIILATVVSLIMANTPLLHAIEAFWHIPLGWRFSGLGFSLTTHEWVNDGLMAVFFFLVGLEIKREVLGGELSSVKMATLPIVAAIGGMIVPALIYYSINFSNPDTSHGWGIPMATDIAFALAILLLAGDKVPPSLKLLLTSLAVVDDLGAIVVIAAFYSGGLAWSYLGAAVLVVLILAAMNYAGVKRFVFYLIPGIVLWYVVYKSGIHATIAGVVLAIFIPYGKGEDSSTLMKLEHALNRPVNFAILPLFALSNTLIPLSGDMIQGLGSAMSIGIFAGLVIGKPLGISLFTWLALKTGLSKLSGGANMKQIISVSILGGIGFTMSIFVALLAFKNPAYIDASKLSILISSTVAAVGGLLVLRLSSAKE
jgi:NhaA family Na+:H+ antiporter